MIILCLMFWELPCHFPWCLRPFAFLPAGHKGSNFPTSSPTLLILWVFFSGLFGSEKLSWFGLGSAGLSPGGFAGGDETVGQVAAGETRRGFRSWGCREWGAPLMTLRDCCKDSGCFMGTLHAELVFPGRGQCAGTGDTAAGLEAKTALWAPGLKKQLKKQKSTCRTVHPRAVEYVRGVVRGVSVEPGCLQR